MTIGHGDHPDIFFADPFASGGKLSHTARGVDFEACPPVLE